MFQPEHTDRDFDLDVGTGQIIGAVATFAYGKEWDEGGEGVERGWQVTWAVLADLHFGAGHLSREQAVSLCGAEAIERAEEAAREQITETLRTVPLHEYAAE